MIDADEWNQYARDTEAEIAKLRAELEIAYGQINRCVEQNKYLESTISRPQDQIALTPKPFCEEHSKFPYEECPWCEAEAQTALVSRHTEYAVCPHCGFADQDSWEFDLGPGPGLDGDGEVSCGSCGKDYFLERHVSVSYSSRKLAARKGEGEK